MAAVLGYWKLESSDDRWDEYMRTIGVNFVLRKVGNSITSYEDIVQDGDNWEVHLLSTFKDVHLHFKLGEEFEEVTPDGRKCKSTFMIEGDELVHYQKGIKAGEVNSRISRNRLDEDTMTLIWKCHIGKPNLDNDRQCLRCRSQPRREKTLITQFMVNSKHLETPRRVPHVEQEMLTRPEHLISPSVFVKTCVAEGKDVTTVRIFKKHQKS